MILKLLVKIGIVGLALAADSDYQLSFDNYRQDYAEFEVKKADYQSLRTFAAEEAVVASAKKMLISRDESWLAYWQTSINSFASIANKTQGEQEEWNQILTQESDWLSNHQQHLTSAKTVEEINGLAEKLNLRKEEYSALAFELNTAIAYGKLADGIIEVKGLNQQLLDKVSDQQIETVKKEAIIRGLGLNLERLEGIEISLEQVRGDLLEDASGTEASKFNEIVEAMMPIHQQLGQITSVTAELAEGITW